MHWCESLEIRRLLAVTFLGDLNTTPSTTSTTLSPRELAVRDSRAFFSGFDPDAGREPWVSDGTAAGTQMLIDLEPGTGSSNPQTFMRVGSGMTFHATSGGSRALFFTDGTAAGTRLLCDAIPESTAEVYQSFYSGSSLLYFCVRMTDSTYDLWRTDGTAAGTFPLRNLGNGFVVSRKVLGGLVHLNVQGGVGGTIVTDGTVAGTMRSNIAVGYGSWTTQNYMWDDLNALTRYSVGATNPITVVYPWPGISSGLVGTFGDQLFIRISDSLYAAPETSVDATTFLRVTGSTNFIAPNYIYQVGTKLYFTALPSGSTTEVLYVLDPVNRFAQVIAHEINLNGGTPRFVGALGDKLVFSTAETSRTRLWLSDGTAAGTAPFATVRAMSGDAGISAASGDRLFFTANNGVNGSQLWTSDGTTTGTLRLTSLQPTDGSSPRFVEIAPGKLVGAATTAAGRELWLSDGTAAGTSMIEIAPGSSSGVLSTVEVVGDKAYFIATDLVNGLQLWESDGTLANTRAVATLESTSQATISLFTAGTRSVYVETKAGTLVTIRRFDTQTGDLRVEHKLVNTQPIFLATKPILWGDRLVFERRTEPTTALSIYITSLIPGESAPVMLLTGETSLYYLPFGDEEAMNAGRLYFFPTIGGRRRLWSTDGTPAGTQIAWDTSIFDFASSFSGVTTVAGPYFVPQISSSPSARQELYRFDPATGQGGLVIDLTPNAGVDSSPQSLTMVAGRLAFSAYTGTSSSSTSPRYLFVMSLGSTQVTELARTSSAATGNVVGIGNRVLFTGADSELWVSDLTPAGTRFFYDFSPSSNSNPTVTPLKGGGAFVAATHIAYGLEGWLVDDTFAPAVLSTQFDLDTATLLVRFDEPLQTQSLDGIAIVDASSGLPLSTEFYQIRATSSAERTTLRIQLDPAIPNGNWRLTLAGGAGNAGVVDRSGNALAQSASFDFYTLAGDANRDRVVDFADLLILTQHYGQAGRRFGEGNLDRSADGVVDFQDLLILAQNYGTTAVTRGRPVQRRGSVASNLLN